MQKKHDIGSTFCMDQVKLRPGPPRLHYGNALGTASLLFSLIAP
jgi:hypothetical protein